MSALVIVPQHDTDVTFQTEFFLGHIARIKSPATLKGYTSNLNIFTAWWLDNPIQQNTVQHHLESFRNYVSKRYTSSKSMNSILSTVRGFYKYLKANKVLDQDFAKGIKNFDVKDEHSKSALDKYQRYELLQHIKTIKPRDQLLIILGMSNGLRVNELANILIEDIVSKDGDMVIYLLRKGYKTKECYTILNPEIYKLIKDFIGERKEGYLFQSQKGKGLASTSVSRRISHIFKGAGIDSKSITPHSLRHTFAILALDSGVDITQIMVALNHKHLSSSEIYVRAYRRHIQSAEKRIDIFG